jgi:hypothetical protein
VVTTGKTRATKRKVEPMNIDMFGKTGAGEGIRTLDPDLGKVVLYP